MRLRSNLKSSRSLSAAVGNEGGASALRAPWLDPEIGRISSRLYSATRSSSNEYCEYEDGCSDDSETIAEGCDAGACIVGDSVDVRGIEVDGAADCVIACGAMFWDAVVVATVVSASEVAVCCRPGP